MITIQNLVVTEMKGFATWGTLLKNETWLEQGNILLMWCIV